MFVRRSAQPGRVCRASLRRPRAPWPRRSPRPRSCRRCDGPTCVAHWTWDSVHAFARVVASTPACTGRVHVEQLEAMRAGEQKAALLLGGCLLGNVLDVAGAKAALEAASGRRRCRVTAAETLAYADVVLPAAVQHERHGTVTNIEGRVTNVTAKIGAPGSAGLTWRSPRNSPRPVARASDSTRSSSAPRSSKRRRATRRCRS